MEIHTRERLVGALVLVAIVVLLVPALLTGRSRVGETPATAGLPAPALEIVLEAPPAAALEQPVPEPELPGAAAPIAATDITEASGPPPPETEPAGQTDIPSLPDDEVPPPAGTPPPVAAPAPPAFAVQLGAFRTRARADQWVSDLRRQGYSAFVFEYRAGGQVLYRVRIGPESDRARAQEIAERLRRAGHTAVVAPHP